MEMLSLTDDTLTRLLAHEGSGSVTLYVPTHRAGAEIRQDPLHLKNLLRKAEQELLELDWPRSRIDSVLGEARKLLDDQSFWRRQQETLALFLFEGDSVAVQAPMDCAELAVVSDRFHLGPLLQLTAGRVHAYVLALSEHQVRLIEADPRGARRVELPEAPESVEEITKFVDPEKHLEFHTGASDHGPDSDRPAVFHGQGVGSDEAKEKKWTLEFIHRVEQAVTDKLREAQSPLVLHAADPLVGLYREQNTHDQLFEDALHGNPEQLQDQQIADKALDLVRPRTEQALRTQLDRYHHLKARSQGSEQVDKVLAAARQGAVETLFIRRDSHCWGRPDDDGGIHDTRQPGDCDLFDAAAAKTRQTGGALWYLDGQQMPDQAELAATFRYENAGDIATA